MPERDFVRPGHVLAPLERPEGKPPVVLGVDGGWLVELARGPDGEFGVAYERVGGIVRVTGQAVLRHPRGHVLQPVSVVMREEDAGELGPRLMGILGS